MNQFLPEALSPVHQLYFSLVIPSTASVFTKGTRVPLTVMFSFPHARFCGESPQRVGACVGAIVGSLVGVFEGASVGTSVGFDVG